MVNKFRHKSLQKQSLRTCPRQHLSGAILSGATRARGITRPAHQWDGAGETQAADPLPNPPLCVLQTAYVLRTAKFCCDGYQTVCRHSDDRATRLRDHWSNRSTGCQNPALRLNRNALPIPGITPLRSASAKNSLSRALSTCTDARVRMPNRSKTSYEIACILAPGGRYGYLLYTFTWMKTRRN